MSTLDTITHYINGVAVDTQSGRYADVFNPALGQPVARVALGTTQEVDAAVQAAEAAVNAKLAKPPATHLHHDREIAQPATLTRHRISAVHDGGHPTQPNVN